MERFFMIFRWIDLHFSEAACCFSRERLMRRPFFLNRAVCFFNRDALFKCLMISVVFQAMGDDI